MNSRNRFSSVVLVLAIIFVAYHLYNRYDYYLHKNKMVTNNIIDTFNIRDKEFYNTKEEIVKEETVKEETEKKPEEVKVEEKVEEKKLVEAKKEVVKAKPTPKPKPKPKPAAVKKEVAKAKPKAKPKPAKKPSELDEIERLLKKGSK